ncbi:MAG: hypothetical protein PF689_10320 [Deltaproteobacteria bacterium]|jgi:hypothetical protein|nr:hypothetical protein [Deltaproteobacteria bacterium]
MNLFKIKLLFILVIGSVLIFTACDDDNDNNNNSLVSCEPAENECEENQHCQQINIDEAFCLDQCIPGEENTCPENFICQRSDADTNLCIPLCDVTEEDSCGEGWSCNPVVLEGENGICQQICSPENNECPDGEVCIPDEDDNYFCEAECNPNQINACGEEFSCELRLDGFYGCYKSVYIQGMVINSTTGDPILAAHIMGVDKTGTSCSDVAVSDASGIYQLSVPVTRDETGALAEGTFTLRASAANYEVFPHGIRMAMPIDYSLAISTEEGWSINNSLTKIALIPLPAEEQGLGMVTGQIITDATSTVNPAGVLVVLETESGSDMPFGFSDLQGNYTIFNVPENDYEARGYKAGLQLDATAVQMVGSALVENINLYQSQTPLNTVSGNINIVDPGDGESTSVVLVPESTFNEISGKGVVPAGLRAPAPPEAPSITGSFTIEGVPDGNYIVLAAFENDYLVQDPDPNISGTEIVHIAIPDQDNRDLELATAFKITGALTIVSPGADGSPEAVEEPVSFIFADDSSEDGYTVVVYNAFGDEVWRDDTLPPVQGSATVEVPYEGPALQTGMYYQFRAMSTKSGDPLSITEDLLGVFYIPVQIQ